MMVNTDSLTQGKNDFSLLMIVKSHPFYRLLPFYHLSLLLNHFTMSLSTRGVGLARTGGGLSGTYRTHGYCLPDRRMPTSPGGVGQHETKEREEKHNTPEDVQLQYKPYKHDNQFLGQGFLVTGDMKKWRIELTKIGGSRVSGHGYFFKHSDEAKIIKFFADFGIWK